MSDIELGFQPPLLTIAPLPRTRVGTVFKRMVPNGQVAYYSSEELPHTTIDRRIIALLVTLARKTGSPMVRVNSVAEFLRLYMDQDATGGATGNIGSVSKAVRRIALMAAAVELGVSHDGLRAMAGQGIFTMAKGYQVLWANGRFKSALVQPGLFDELYFEWSSEAYKWLVEKSVPFDLRVGMKIQGELANDLYHMINRRNFWMHKQDKDHYDIKWSGLYAQYSQTGGILNDSQMKSFRRTFKVALDRVPGSGFQVDEKGLHLMRTPLIVDPEAKTTGYL